MTKARTLADNFAADINAITASTPLTGGGTSGTVTVSIQDGTTSQKGAVQLEDSTASTSTTKASTPSSVKSAYDLANGAIPKTLTSTTGDIIYASGANTPARLGIGSAGNVLTVASGIPSWAAPAGGGKILQVVQASTTSTVATSSSSFGDTALSASITPSSTSSKVVVLLTQNTRIASITGSHNDIGGATRLMRGATVLLNQINGPSMYLGGLSPNGTEARHTITAAYLDSPATTSATTYKPQIKVNYTSTSYEAIEFQTLILMEVGA